MAKVKMSKKKFKNLQACANSKGIIAAAAMDQRGSLQKALAKEGAKADSKQMGQFKASVTQVLTPHATAILLDPEYGLGASKKRAKGRGLLLAYEKSGYDTTGVGRMPDLIENMSAKRLEEAGATGVKILLYYNPSDKKEINTVKQAFIERIGSECDAVGLPFFLEPLAYDDGISDEFAFAKKKPVYVRKIMEEFSKERYGVDILKVEIPFNANYVEGLASGDKIAYSREKAMQLSSDIAAVATKPFIYLSAGVNMDVFASSLEIVGEAGVPYSGVLCGRATWKNGIPVYAKQGNTAFKKWLNSEGVDNIKKLNKVVNKYAKPWWDIYGGKKNLQLI